MPFSDLDPVVTVTCGIFAVIIGFLLILHRRELSQLYKKLRKIGYPPYPAWAIGLLGLIGLVIGVVALISGISRW